MFYHWAEIAIVLYEVIKFDVPRHLWGERKNIRCVTSHSKNKRRLFDELPLVLRDEPKRLKILERRWRVKTKSSAGIPVELFCWRHGDLSHTHQKFDGQLIQLFVGQRARNQRGHVE